MPGFNSIENFLRKDFHEGGKISCKVISGADLFQAEQIPLCDFAINAIHKIMAAALINSPA